MHSTEYNLCLAEAMLPEMEPYLLSSELFWPLAERSPSGSPPFPRLTFGNLLLTIDELEACSDQFTAEQRERYRQVQGDYAALLERWPAAIERKAQQELGARLNLWRAYIEELQESNSEAAHYVREVRNRVRFQRLLPLAGEVEEVTRARDEVRALDSQLQTRFEKGAFIWDGPLESLYPQETFPYLYGRPKRRRTTAGA
jgi:hypothetical protein